MDGWTGVPKAGLAAALSLGLGAGGMAWAQEGLTLPMPERDVAPSGPMSVAVFAGGCFWGVQGVFQHVEGVANAVSGYAGGPERAAHYMEVGTGTTGHAEAVEVTYDPSVVSYGELLRIFFSVAHDPTQLNRQGPDTGPQYRSAVFPRSGAQREVTEAYIAQLDAAGLYQAALVTTIEPDKAFYPAESYHQDYLTLNPTAPYIVYNDLPKIENLRRLFPEEYRDDPVLVSEARRAG